VSEQTATILVAIISAAIALYGYLNERRKDRENQLRATRQEILSRLITNLTQMTQLGESLHADPNLPNPREDMKGWYQYVQHNYPLFWQNTIDRTEIQALLSIYGTDESIQAVAKYWKENIEVANGLRKEPADAAEMVLGLRKSIFPETEVSKIDVQMLLAR
jgi:hypothetical protein